MRAWLLPDPKKPKAQAVGSVSALLGTPGLHIQVVFSKKSGLPVWFAGTAPFLRERIPVLNVIFSAETSDPAAMVREKSLPFLQELSQRERAEEELDRSLSTVSGFFFVTFSTGRCLILR